LPAARLEKQASGIQVVPNAAGDARPAPSESADLQRRRLARTSDREALGSSIRAERKRQNRTLRELASAAEVSVSLISQVERGTIDPSLDSLRNIAEALGTTPFQLFADGSSRSRLVRAGTGLRLPQSSPGFTIELLSRTLEGSFEVGRWSLQPGGVAVSQARGHGGEEATLILSGVVGAEVGDERYELAAGDLITFDARIPHRIFAISDEPAEGLFIISPPSF
jgi:transcriptional regulator with XRE-family HTH domain